MPFWPFYITDAEWRGLLNTVNRIDRNLIALNRTFNRMEDSMTVLDDAIQSLETQVQANTDAETSAIQLLNNLADMIQQNATDPAKVNELAAKLKASAEALGAAVVANTPSEAA